MEKIFEQAKDLHVVGTILYTKDEDIPYVYYDADCTEKVAAKDLEECFIKGCFVKTSEVDIARPVSYWFSPDDGYGTISIVDMTTTAAEDNVATTIEFCSSEYTGGEK